MRHLLRLHRTQLIGRWLVAAGLSSLLALVLLPFVTNAAAQALQETVHIVRHGETLSEIAKSYQVPIAAIMQQNAIRDPDAIYVGQKLSIPSTADAAADPPSDPGEETMTAIKPGLAAVQSIQTTSLNSTYSVRAGDTLAWIALRYGIDLDALRAVNDLDAGEGIQLGQQLVLPATDEELRVTPAPTRYTVEPGDSLGLIAQAHDVSLAVLMAFNRITNPNLIQPGQELAIPVPSVTRSAPVVGPAHAGFHYHNVLPGDTLSELAKTYDSTPQAIVRYNNLPDTETLFSGLEVRIPFGPAILERRLPPVPQSGTEFVISISRQRCWVMRSERVVHEWKCSTGQGRWITRTGTFHVKTKLEMAKSSAYRLDMPYWLGLYDVGAYENGIHGLPVDWDTGEQLWDTLVGQPATFGCAMLLDEDAATLFNLAYIGMPVHIVD